MNIVFLAVLSSIIMICVFVLGFLGISATIMAERYDEQNDRLRRANAEQRKEIEYLQEQLVFIEISGRDRA